MLQIEELRAFRYESVYFDTPELLSYHQHAHGRRRRTKLRTRAYLDSGDCLLEFKRVGARGETIKERFPHPLAGRFDLDVDALAFARQKLGFCADASLRPSLVTTYQRTTLVDTVRGSRITCDVDLRFVGPTGATFGPLAGVAVLESKSQGGDSPADHTLRRMGVRPVSLSKYCAGLAVLDRRLPANRWNRELRTWFGWSPEALRRRSSPDSVVSTSPAQELKRCCVFSRPSTINDSTASAASETWNGSSLRSTVE